MIISKRCAMFEDIFPQAKANIDCIMQEFCIFTSGKANPETQRGEEDNEPSKRQRCQTLPGGWALWFFQFPLFVFDQCHDTVDCLHTDRCCA